jgi:hemerythrin-like domain-containing protein
MSEQTSTIEAVFLNVENSLGQTDKPGSFLPYRPSSQQLLETFKSQGWRIGAIINLADGVKESDYVQTIRNGILSEDAKTGRILTIGDFISAEDFVSSRAAGAEKPDRRIYEFAARKFGVRPEACVYVSQDTTEDLGALSAGMKFYPKLCPPGLDFPPAMVGRIGASSVDSGREFQALLEHEHLLGERIFACGETIAAWIDTLIDVPAWNQKLIQLTKEKRWEGPPNIDIPPELKKAMAYMTYLLDHFADQVHLRAEEETFEFAVACGMDSKDAKWVFDQHDQVRSYWAALDIAWRRIKEGDASDRWFALRDFQTICDAFVFLFKAHAIREDYATYTAAGDKFNATDDALVMNLIAHTGPSDITPYVNMVGSMEKLLMNSPSRK